VITQETFEKFTPPRPTISNPEKPPKPPSSSLVDEITQVNIIKKKIIIIKKLITCLFISGG